MKFRKPAHPKAVGELTEQIVSVYLIDKEVKVSKPFGDNLPYDFILDVYGELIKVQVKTARPKKHSTNVIEYNTISTRVNAKGNYKKYYTEGDIDLFLIYSYEVDEVYVMSNCGLRSRGTFNLEYPCTGQKSNIRLAENFTLDKFLSSLNICSLEECLKKGKTYSGWANGVTVST